MTTKLLRLRLLLVEDVEDDAQLLLLQLREGGIDPDCVRVESPEELKAALNNGPWDVVFADYSLPSFTGLDALRIMQEKGMDLPFILVSGVIGEEQAVEAMKSGAHDFILKGQYVRLMPSLKRALKDAELRHERRQTAEELSQYREHLEELVQQRSAELKLANVELQSKNGELAAANETLRVQSDELAQALEETRRSEEEKERLNADLAAANLELEAFNYSVAHDLRQPLNSIGMYCQSIKMIYGDSLDEQCLGFVQRSYEAMLCMKPNHRSPAQFFKHGARRTAPGQGRSQCAGARSGHDAETDRARPSG